MVRAACGLGRHVRGYTGLPDRWAGGADPGRARLRRGCSGTRDRGLFASSSLASFVSGRVVERVGYSLGMRVAVLVSAASLLSVAALAGSWATLVFCLALGGLANAISHPATHLFMARKVPQDRQGLAFGVKQAAIPTATLLAGLAVPSLATTVGWRWAFVASAALALVVSLLVPKDDPDAGPHRPKDKVARTGDARLGPLLLLALGMALGSAAANPLGVFIVESSVAAGIEVGAAGLLLALGSAVGIGVRVLLGWFTDRREGGSLNLVAGIMALGTLGFLLLAGGAGWVLVIGVVLAFGAGWGWPGLFNFTVVKTSPGAPAAATRRYPDRRVGRGSGRAVGLRPGRGGLLVRYGLARLRRARFPCRRGDTRRTPYAPAGPPCVRPRTGRRAWSLVKGSDLTFLCTSGVHSQDVVRDALRGFTGWSYVRD